MKPTKTTTILRVVSIFLILESGLELNAQGLFRGKSKNNAEAIRNYEREHMGVLPPRKISEFISHINHTSPDLTFSEQLQSEYITIYNSSIGMPLASGNDSKWSETVLIEADPKREGAFHWGMTRGVVGCVIKPNHYSEVGQYLKRNKLAFYKHLDAAYQFYGVIEVSTPKFQEYLFAEKLRRTGYFLVVGSDYPQGGPQADLVLPWSAVFGSSNTANSEAARIFVERYAKKLASLNPTWKTSAVTGSDFEFEFSVVGPGVNMFSGKGTKVDKAVIKVYIRDISPESTFDATAATSRKVFEDFESQETKTLSVKSVTIEVDIEDVYSVPGSSVGVPDERFNEKPYLSSGDSKVKGFLYDDLLVPLGKHFNAYKPATF